MRAVFDENMESSDLTRSVHFFHGSSNLIEVERLGCLLDVANMNQVFTSCTSMETNSSRRRHMRQNLLGIQFLNDV